MIGIGPFEIFCILVVLLLVVGPQRMPEIVRFLSRIMREVRAAASEMRDQVEQMAEIDEIRKDAADVGNSLKQAVVPDDLRLIDPTASPAAGEDGGAAEAPAPPADTDQQAAQPASPGEPGRPAGPAPRPDAGVEQPAEHE